ncbi:MAG: DUF4150 domain-containing protein [Polyangiaceae bacterium]|nr:DUF4150 domain-containing protein [Polyangiaceae bacterium]
MLSASTRNSGQNVASPDVCNTPTGTGVDAPIPYVNTATHSQAVAFATTVMIEGGNALTMASSIPSTSGDESGTSHPVTRQEARFSSGSPCVFIEQMPAITLSCTSSGNAMNASSGAVVSPGAATVMFTYAGAQAEALSTDAVRGLAAAVRGAPDVVTWSREEGVLVVRIARFTEDVVTLVRRALRHCGACERVTLDLRGNPGGDLDAALALAAMFTPSGAALARIVWAEGDVEERRAHGGPEHEGEVAVRVDGGTASAAEVLAAALVDVRGAHCLGERTAGKGTVQGIVPGPDGSATFATIAEVLRADGRRIHGVGVEPREAR